MSAKRITVIIKQGFSFFVPLLSVPKHTTVTKNYVFDKNMGGQCGQNVQLYKENKVFGTLARFRALLSHFVRDGPPLSRAEPRLT